LVVKRLRQNDPEEDPDRKELVHVHTVLQDEHTNPEEAELVYVYTDLLDDSSKII
jgi:hypothetical protein